MIDNKGAAEKANSRITAVFIILIIAGAAAVLQLLHLQILRYSFYREKAQKMHLTTMKQQLGRGTIYDRNEKPIAESIKSNSIYIRPAEITEKAKAAAVLSAAFGISKEAVMKKINKKSLFEYIKRKTDAETAEKVLGCGIKGIHTQLEEKRNYPLADAASHVIGFSGMDNKGLEGLELLYEKQLQGKIGRVQIRLDVDRQPVMIDSVDIKKAEKGADIYLTLDSNIQRSAKAELDAVIKKFNAKAGSIIVMNPKTGEIYGLVNAPSYNPDDTATIDKESRRNRAVTDIYEPGSTFKIFAMSAFLQEFKNAEEQKVFCGNGGQEFFGRIVHDHEPYGWLTVPEVIKYSSNIGMVNLALKLHQDSLYKEFIKFGFGSLTKTDMPDEVTGMLNYKNWDNTTLTSIPYGQEVAVTPLQLMRAYAVIANGGWLVTPHVVSRIEKNGKVLYRAKNSGGEKVLDEKQCRRLTEMLKLVTEKDGSGYKAAIPGYMVAGKTGTAQKHNEDKKGSGYAAGKYVASFIGFLPADKPEILTLVVIDEPKPQYYGSEVAAPAFKNINSLAINSLHVAPQESTIAEEIAPAGAAAGAKMPDLHMRAFVEAKKTLTAQGIGFKHYGCGKTVIGQSPKPGTKMTSREPAYVFLGDVIKDSDIRVYMPDIRGLPVRKAMEILNGMGIKAKCTGSGYAVTQDPKPGVALKNRECTVSFDLKDAG